MIFSKAQIVFTLGPASSNPDVLKDITSYQSSAARLNFSWGDFELHSNQIKLIRHIETEFKRQVPVIVDLPGPRIQHEDGHTFNHDALSAITEKDEEYIKFAVEYEVDYIAVSFVSSKEDIHKCREVIDRHKGKQKIIAKIERKEALNNIDEIIDSADAVMIARGDLGDNIKIEQVPFVQDSLIKKAKGFGKPVIVATQMLLSMVDNPSPTRAEVTDVTTAILEGADAVMLSEETAKGMYPAEAVKVMEKIITEAEKHLQGEVHFNTLKRIN
ncbi:hypothetical protein H6790_02515 [Candidatus Nomurabacteria bacterium]|nr:hypothetical protein [Candidatus Nomurabacteria bacterium]MCB9820797.1 hypothetical protein [Candidatus Nomurabacteria bacterium]